MIEEEEIHKNMINGEVEIIKSYVIYVERESVSLGDDVYAPNRAGISIEINAKLSDLLNKLMKSYLSNLYNNCTWKIAEDNRVLGYIKFSRDEEPKYELAIPDDYIANLNIKPIFCSKIKKGE